MTPPINNKTYQSSIMVDTCIQKINPDVDELRGQHLEIDRLFRTTNKELMRYDTKLSHVYQLRHTLYSLSDTYDLELTINNLEFQEKILVHDRNYFMTVVGFSLKKYLFDLYYSNSRIAQLCLMFRELHSASLNLKVDIREITGCRPKFNIMSKAHFTLRDIGNISDDTIHNIDILDSILNKFRCFADNLDITKDTGVEINSLNLSMVTQVNKLILEYNQQVRGLTEIIEFHTGHIKKVLRDNAGMKTHHEMYRERFRKLVDMVRDANKRKENEKKEAENDAVNEKETTVSVETPKESQDEEHQEEKKKHTIDKTKVTNMIKRLNMSKKLTHQPSSEQSNPKDEDNEPHG